MSKVTRFVNDQLWNVARFCAAPTDRLAIWSALFLRETSIWYADIWNNYRWIITWARCQTMHRSELTCQIHCYVWNVLNDHTFSGNKYLKTKLQLRSMLQSILLCEFKIELDAYEVSFRVWSRFCFVFVFLCLWQNLCSYPTPEHLYSARLETFLYWAASVLKILHRSPPDRGYFVHSTPGLFALQEETKAIIRTSQWLVQGCARKWPPTLINTSIFKGRLRDSKIHRDWKSRVPWFCPRRCMPWSGHPICDRSNILDGPYRRQRHCYDVLFLIHLAPKKLHLGFFAPFELSNSHHIGVSCHWRNNFSYVAQIFVWGPILSFLPPQKSGFHSP